VEVGNNWTEYTWPADVTVEKDDKTQSEDDSSLVNHDHDQNEVTGINTASTIPEIGNERSFEMEKTLLTLVEDVANLKGVQKTVV